MPTNEWWIYGSAEYFEWRESLGGKRLLKESGPRLGIGAEGRHLVASGKLPLRISGEALFGSVDYSGATIGEESFPVRTTTDYLSYRLEGDAGYRFAVAATIIEPFTGLGYRAWDRELNDTTIVVNGENLPVQGYVEEWSSVYVYTGVRLQSQLGASPGRGLFAEADIKYPISTRNEVDAIGVTVKPGGRGAPSVEAGGWIGPLKASLYYDRQHYGRSPSMGGFFQPESKADIYGFRLGYRF